MDELPQPDISKLQRLFSHSHEPANRRRGSRDERLRATRADPGRCATGAFHIVREQVRAMNAGICKSYAIALSGLFLAAGCSTIATYDQVAYEHATDAK